MEPMDIEIIEIPFLRGRNLRVRKQTLVLLGIMTLGILLRFAFLGRWSLWTDELYTWRMVNTDSALQQGFPQDQNPPLYDLLMRSWVELLDCQSEVCLRLPSAIAGIAAIPFMWMIGLAIGGKRLALFSALLFAASPLHIWYSRDARIYSLGVFAAVCSVYFYLQVFRRGHWAYALGLVVTTLMGLYTGYSVLAIWFLEMGFVLLLWHHHGRDRRRLLLWIYAQIAIILGTTPWVPFMKQQLSGSFAFNWPLPFQSILPISLSATLEQVFITALIAGFLLILLMLAGSAFFIANPRLQDWIDRKKVSTAVICVLLVLAVTILGIIPRGLSLRRQLLVLLPIAILLGAWGMWTLKKHALNWILLILAVGLSVYTVLSPPYQDWRSVTSYLEENVEPGEQVYLAPNWSIFAFDYYVEGTMNYEGMKAGDLLGDTTARIPPGEPVWLVVEQHPSLVDVTQGVEMWFADHAGVIERESFSRYLVVFKYQIQP